MKKRGLLRDSFIGVFITCVSVLLISCGAGEGPAPADGGAVTFTGGSISLATSQVSVKSDNSDSATITATVLDKNNAVVKGATVTFTADGGQISVSSVDTDEDGRAKVEFRSGTVDKSNRVATVTAQVAGLNPVQIPIDIRGTTISLSTDSTNIIVGESPATLTIVVKDAGSVQIYKAPVTISAEPAGVVTLSQETGNTDVSGKLVVYVTGTGTGVATVTVRSLGYTATQEYVVGAAGAVFGIREPSGDLYSLRTNEPLTIKVDAPNQTSVLFATTFGGWDGGSDTLVTKPVSNGPVEATLTSSKAGTATVEVSDPNNLSLRDSLKVAFSSPSSEATKISLQASARVVAPSSGGMTHSVTLTVTTRDNDDVGVYGVPIVFSIENPTGGGEFISPVIAFTDPSGIATSTFTSGSLSSEAAGVTVTAKDIDKPSLADSISIVIGGTAGSVVIGQSTKIKSNEANTAYILPMSVLVADANGNPVSGATVSLSVWPVSYYTGFWEYVVNPVTGEKMWTPKITGTYPNEDINRNLILDGGEEGTSNPYNQDGRLTPPSSAAGTVPGTVTTDEYGVGNFNLVYLKNSAAWIEDEVKASTLVWGTETISTLKFQLPWQKGEEESLPPSPYGP